MGVAHVTAAKTVKGTLAMEKLPVAGLITTHSSDSYVTDPAAGGTAMATGHKSYNGAISVSPQLDTLKTVLEYAEANAKSTGLVSTCRITHATPGCFAAHVDDREKENEIAVQMAHSGVDVMIGGGLGYFTPSTRQYSFRKDTLDLTRLLARKHPVITDRQTFLEHQDGTGLYALLAPKDMAGNPARRIPLADMALKAIEILSKNEKGFFLMVEGSQIDWANHANRLDVSLGGATLLGEVLAFDEAVKVVLDWTRAQPGRHDNTLLVVAADHDCGDRLGPILRFIRVISHFLELHAQYSTVDVIALYDEDFMRVISPKVNPEIRIRIHQDMLAAR